MYPSVLAAKSNAKNFLKGNYISAAAVSLTFLASVLLLIFVRELIGMLFNVGDIYFKLSIDILHPVKLMGFFALAVVTFCLVCFLVGPLFLGAFRWFWNLTADYVMSVGQVFYYFNREMYSKTVKFIVRLILKVAVCALLSYLPYILTVTVSSPQLYKLFGGTVPIFMASLAPLTTLFWGLGIAVTALYIFRMYLIVPLYCNDDTITQKEAFLLARHFSYYTASGYFSFLFKFIGHFLLCLLAIPILYVLPYFACANAMYCRFALNYGMQINRFQKK